MLSDAFAVVGRGSEPGLARAGALEVEVLDLQHGLEAVEERARSELGMIGKDETFIDGSYRSGVFEVHEFANIQMSDLTIRRGSWDGAITNHGQLSLWQTSLEDNRAISGLGGGITNLGQRHSRLGLGLQQLELSHAHRSHTDVSSTVSRIMLEHFVQKFDHMPNRFWVHRVKVLQFTSSAIASASRRQ